MRIVSGRRVRITVGSGRSTTATSTAAGVMPSPSASSSSTSPPISSGLLAVAELERLAQRRGEAHRAGSSAKKAPPLHRPGGDAAFGERDLGQLVIDRAGDQRVEPAADLR